MPRIMLLKTIERRIRELMQKAEEIKRRKDNPALRKVVRLMREHRISMGELRTAMNGRGGTSSGRANRVSPAS